MLVRQRIENGIGWISLNRPDKSNAFDEHLISDLIASLEAYRENPLVKVVVLRGEGKHFSAGADLAWMARMAQASQAVNQTDAERLAYLLHLLYDYPKPTVVEVKGATYGGGIGLVAACDIAIAAECAIFCFSEVKLGLIPAVISPFVMKSIGPRETKYLFLSADSFSASKAQTIGLIHHLTPLENLTLFTQHYAEKLVALPEHALSACKTLLNNIDGQPINTLAAKTSGAIAAIRQHPETQTLLHQFLSKKNDKKN